MNDFKVGVSWLVEIDAVDCYAKVDVALWAMLERLDLDVFYSGRHLIRIR